jgi:cobalt/nickel transport system permease protein
LPKKILIVRIFFILTFFILLSIRNLEYLLICIPVLWLISYKKILKLNIRVIKSIIVFNLGVSLGYIIMAFIKHLSPWHYILYINLKVYSLTYFVFWFFAIISPVQFMAFSKDLGYLTTITLSQIFSYKKTFEDFKLAFKSRVLKLTDKDPKFITRTFEFFLNKALHDANERTLAMKARGFFDNG